MGDPLSGTLRTLRLMRVRHFSDCGIIPKKERVPKSPLECGNSLRIPKRPEATMTSTPSVSLISKEAVMSVLLSAVAALGPTHSTRNATPIHDPLSLFLRLNPVGNYASSSRQRRCALRFA